ncbi:MAG: hypothetical protein IJY25_03770 [Bacilli bacterium]|nr:hypothetical protein [Bacilli bacterium]MBQ9072251.1 hypothetical protein [Bacilli bacterium]
MKKILLSILCAIMIVGLAGCGNSNNTDLTENNDNLNNSENQNSKTDFSNKLTFMGYDISYPSDAGKNSSDYGNLLGTSEYIVIVEAPSTAGILKEVSNINDAPKVVEEYVLSTLEHKVRSLFNFDSTEQITEKTTKTTKNGIEMLRAEGVFKNTRDNTEVEFVAYYLLAGDNGNMPVYLVGIPMKDSTISIKNIMDEMSSHITKYKG